MKKNYYQIRFDEKVYRALCDECNRRRRVYRTRQIVSRILWSISVPIVILTLVFGMTLLFLNYTEIEETVFGVIIILGCICGFAAWKIDPDNSLEE